MASDLPPFLSHNARRRVAWRGHEAFPRKVIQVHECGEWGSFGPLKLEDLRIFRRGTSGSGGPVYVLVSETEIQRYMEDPDYV